MKRACSMLLLVLTLISMRASGQEQLIKVTGFNASIPKSEDPGSMDKLVCARTDLATKPTISAKDVTELRTMVESLASTKETRIGNTVLPGKTNFAFESGDIAIIHLANWEKQDIKSQIWLTVSKDGRWLRQNAVDTRLFGKHRIILIFVHSGLTVADPVVYNLTATKKTPENVQHVIELGKALASGTLGAFDDPKTSCAWGFSVFNINSVPSDLDVQAFAQKSVVPAPSSSSTSRLPDAPSTEAKTPEIGSRKFNNEDIYWWDVSLMLQVKSVNDVQYNATDGTVQPAKVTKEDVFAVVDLFPLRALERHWMVKGQFIRVPFSAAIPLNSKPLDRPFFGMGLGTKEVQFMAGISYSQVTAPKNLAVGQATTAAKLTADSETHRVSKLMLGLNVSVASIVKSLSSKTK